MLTAMCHDLQNGKRFASIDEQLRVLHELIQVRFSGYLENYEN